MKTCQEVVAKSGQHVVDVTRTTRLWVAGWPKVTRGLMKEVPLKLRPSYHKVVKIKDFSGLIIGLVCEFVETSTIQGLIFISTAQSVAAKELSSLFGSKSKKTLLI